MKRLALTKGSEKALRASAAGQGRVFLSAGDDTTTRSFDFGFSTTVTGTSLSMGTAPRITLTDDQVARLGHYAGDHTHERD